MTLFVVYCLLPPQVFTQHVVKIAIDEKIVICAQPRNQVSVTWDPAHPGFEPQVLDSCYLHSTSALPAHQLPSLHDLPLIRIHGSMFGTCTDCKILFDWPSLHNLPFFQVNGSMIITCTDCKILFLQSGPFLPLAGHSEGSLLRLRLQQFQLFLLSQRSCKFCFSFLPLGLYFSLGRCPCCFHSRVRFLDTPIIIFVCIPSLVFFGTLSDFAR